MMVEIRGGGVLLKLLRQAFADIRKLMYNSNIMKNKSGFTLAEVLITLAIIGVVAALTIPTLVHKYQIKALEVGFNRMDKQIRDALLELQFENNTDDFFKLTSQAGVYGNDLYRKMFYNKFNIVDEYPHLMFVQKFGCPKNFKNEEQDCFVNGFSIYPNQILKDGSTIGYIANSWATYIYFDTNGPYKAPNRLGYDVFLITTTTAKNLGEQYKEVEKCSLNSNSQENGWRCYYYAKNNINPDDPTKGYWESLK